MIQHLAFIFSLATPIVKMDDFTTQSYMYDSEEVYKGSLPFFSIMETNQPQAKSLDNKENNNKFSIIYDFVFTQLFGTSLGFCSNLHIYKTQLLKQVDF